MNQYDERALIEIRKWKNPPKGWLAKKLKPVGEAVDKGLDYVMDNKVGQALTKAIQGAVSLLNDGAAWSVRTNTILKEFRKDGHESVNSLKDIHHLSLEQVDKTVGYLAAKYKGLAAAEGAAAGATGLPGLIADIPAQTLLMLRAVNEYAAYYGYDVGVEPERHYALNVLLASTSGGAAKKAVLAELRRIAVQVAKKAPWKKLEQSVVVKLIQEIAKALGIRLTKRKLGAVVPVVGAAIAGGMNARQLAETCTSASMLYRERFLADKHGIAVLEQ